ncbi:putative Flavin-containing monooxygenase YUCCA9 [Streptomyces afghaniensis 772] [Streptomyces afghaniensis]
MDYDVIIIGGGQAGLAMGYFLKKSGLSFLIVEKETSIGESWRKRYDTLTLFTPRFYSSLPGFPLNGDLDGYPTKEEIADYLFDYATTFSLPVQLNTEVKELSKTKEGFKVVTNASLLAAKKVIIATGSFQKPLIPSFASTLSKNVVQLHTSQYHNPKQIKEGPVLIVGAGNSGAQVAAELSDKYLVYLSVGHKIRFLPQNIGNKSIFWWFEKMRIYKASTNSKIGQWLRKKPDPLFGFDLRAKIKSGAITVFPRTERIVDDTFEFLDKRTLKVNTVIWATGFYHDYSWSTIPQVVNVKGDPIHKKGITNIAGLYFLGLPWQRNRASSLLQGVGDDAAYIYQHVRRNME